jgi:hypothetical protein
VPPSRDCRPRAVWPPLHGGGRPWQSVLKLSCGVPLLASTSVFPITSLQFLRKASVSRCNSHIPRAKFSVLSFPALVAEIELDRGPPSCARQRKVRNAAADVRLGCGHFTARWLFPLYPRKRAARKNRCPPLAKCGHSRCNSPCPLYLKKRTCAVQLEMSAKGQ